MNAIALMLFGLSAFALGYLVYSRFIAKRIYRLDPQFRTPAHELRDEIDYVPTNRFVLWGHHFTSVAGAAPIVGPAIAVIWGWGPAFAWVIVGTVFIAGVHDLGAIWASVRHRARSIGTLTGILVSERARALFMIVIFLLLLMVNAVFAVVIARLFTGFPESVVPAWAAIGVALILGQLIYRRVIGLAWLSVFGVIALYGAIWLGQYLPVTLPDEFVGLGANAQWIIILFSYAAIASLLPVWVLLQPRDYINGLQLFIGLGLIFLAVALANPTVVAPLYNTNLPDGVPPLIPLLFVTIACGAISGFHGLVASGTTSKQLDREPDARFVGYFGAVGEGCLALAAIIACTAGFATLGEWEALYSGFAAGGLDAFVEGGAAIMHNGYGLPLAVGTTLLAVMAVLFAATTMDTGIRLQRYIVQEWGNIYGIDWLTRRAPATILAVGCCLALAFGAGGTEGTGGLAIWPLFGTTNQLLAALTLLVISLLVVRLGRPPWYTLVPMIGLILMTLAALLYQLLDFYRQENWFLLGLDALILVAAVMVALETAAALVRARREHSGS
ncbi:carbon starvation protein A [Wenzhouxiangella sp. AB-CW3]|uniref:carbon starvation CstA family protein n=1 Tax=Wenzhouxiangella sp. AB-CW3 TaxID=2771012 RepID=UPI00168BAB86|nr:carbon starvation protein A [Wenzhouxiangella sp. AB-CW3]QOC23624.1 carbon starvation protein A [Wenzhouxiangella sp. AB-CW3]